MNRTKIAVWLRRIFLSLPFAIVAGLVVLYALAGFFLAPYLIKREIPRFAEEKLKARAAVAEARVIPFLLTLELKGFELAEGGSQPVVAFDRLFVDLEASGLFRWAWTFNEIVLAATSRPSGRERLSSSETTVTYVTVLITRKIRPKVRKRRIALRSEVARERSCPDCQPSWKPTGSFCRCR